MSELELEDTLRSQAEERIVDLAKARETKDLERISVARERLEQALEKWQNHKRA